MVIGGNAANGSRIRREEVISKLRRHEIELKGLGVERLYLFGSIARDQATESSGVDLFFDCEKERSGAFNLTDVKQCAAAILGGRIGVVTREGLDKLLRRHIEATAVRVF